MTGSPLIIRCRTAREAAVLDVDSSVTACAVELGTGLETPDEAGLLVRAFLERTEGCSVQVVTRRGTLAHSVPQLRALVREFPQLRLCLDFGELYFGSEGLLGSWREWKSSLRELAPHVDGLVAPSGGAERTLRAGGIVEFVLGLLVSYRFRWLKRLVGPDVENHSAIGSDED